MGTIETAAQVVKGVETAVETGRKAADLIKEGPVLLRVPQLALQLADGLENRRIAVVSSSSQLKLELASSGLFQEKNIRIVSGEALSELKDEDLILLDYATIHNEEESVVSKKLDELLQQKKPQDGLIVYCSPQLRIPQSLYQKLGNTPNTVVVQLYGRLLSDILLMMLTTAPSRGKG